MKPIALSLLSVSLSSLLLAQQRLNIRTNNSCSYYGEVITDPVYGFSSSEEAQDVVKRITNAMGLEPKFELKAANVPNALATIQDNKRVILYSQNFMNKIQNATGTDWAGIAILAHEIGHHLNGHTLEEDGSRPEIELEADRFSGHVLAKLGAKLAEAQSAVKVEASERGSATHPPRSARLEAIAVGWNEVATKSRPTRERQADEPVTKLDPLLVRDKVNKEPATQPQPQVGNIQINYLGDWYACQIPITVTIAGYPFVPNQNPFYINNLPSGWQNYSVTGSISCNYIGNCVVSGQGQILIKPNAHSVFNLNWQNTTYGGCTIWLTAVN